MSTNLQDMKVVYSVYRKTLRFLPILTVHHIVSTRLPLLNVHRTTFIRLLLLTVHHITSISLPHPLIPMGSGWIIGVG